MLFRLEKTVVRPINIFLQKLWQSLNYREKLHHRYWENEPIMWWEKIPSPVRPSNGDIDIYRKFLKQTVEPKKILILGSTPELRDLAAEEHGAHIYVADFSNAMFHSMSRFMRGAVRSKETFVEENWLRLQFPKNHFDVILGDLILHQVPPSFEPQLLEKIKSLLAPSGVFIGRFQYLHAGYSPSNAERIIERELEKPIPDRQKFIGSVHSSREENCGDEWTQDMFGRADKFIPLKLRILWCSADHKKRSLSRTLSARLIDEYTEKHGAKNALLNRIKISILRKEEAFRTWSPPSEKELVQMLTQYFSIVGREVAADYEDSRYYPIIALKK